MGWLRVRYGAASTEANGRVSLPAARATSPHPPATHADSGAPEADSEKNRMQFVELLLKTREVSAGTTYEEARKLLVSSPAWHAVNEKTRKTGNLPNNWTSS